jgi:hypothetical protein
MTNRKFKLDDSFKAAMEENRPQDIPAVCNYSGLPSVEHYSSREITIEDIHNIHKEMTDKEDIHKEIKIEKADIDFMYNWIREKSGK